MARLVVGRSLAVVTFKLIKREFSSEQYQQSAMMKTDAGTCASLSVSLLTTSSRLSNHFLLLRSISGSGFIFF